MKKNSVSRVFAILMSIMMIFTMMPGMAFADNTVVLVSSASDLPSEIPTGTICELTADITLSSGQQIETLAGVLDGKGYTITLADKPLANNVSGTIQNLGVLGSQTLSGSATTGSIANTLTGTIQNCFSKVNITGADFTDIGCIVGKMNNAIVRNSYYLGEATTGKYGYVGAISCYATNGTNLISDCYHKSGDLVAYSNSGLTKTNTAKKTDTEFASANIVILLNNDIAATGYIWELKEGSSHPTLVIGEITEEVDKTGLKAAIDSAEQLVEADYTPESWQSFKTVLANAKTVYGDNDATKSEVNTATSELEAAINNLEKKKPLIPVAVPAGVTPIEVGSVSDLDTIGSGRGNYYILTQDVTITSGDWYMPFDDFDGIFDGNGHTITFDGQRYSGLFKNVGTNGVVQNVHFAGTLAGDFGACGTEIKGAVINCYSEVTGDNASGFAKRLNGGVLSNCYSVSTAADGVIIEQTEDTNGNPYTGKLNNVYWLNSLTQPVDLSKLTVSGGGAMAEADMKTLDFVKSLNDNRGTYGTAWGQSSNGYPYFGENQEYKPEEEDALPANKTAIAFTPNGGTAEVIADQALSVDTNTADAFKVAGVFSLPDYEGEGVEWSSSDTDIAAFNIETGEFYVYKEGSVVITATAGGEIQASVKVTVFTSVIEEIQLSLTASNHSAVTIEDGKATVQGSDYTTIDVKAKYEGEEEFTDISSSAFNFSVTENAGIVSMMSDSNGFKFKEPGTATVTVTAKSNETVTASVEVTSAYVAVESVVPAISGQTVIHERNGSSDGGLDFVSIPNSVTVTPANASFADNFTITSGDESVATYSYSLPVGYVPHKAGTVTFTAEIDDNGTKKKGTSEVTFVYKNPLKSVSAENNNLTVKTNEKISAGLIFEGTSEIEKFITETGMSWSFDKEGIISITRGSAEFIEGNYVLSTEYTIRGLQEGTVTVTGTPLDTTGGAEAVTFQVTVTAGAAETPADNEALTAAGIESAAKYLQTLDADSMAVYGGEWYYFTLARAGYALDADNVEAYLTALEKAYTTDLEIDKEDKLKPTTLARVILAMEAIDADATCLGDVNLVELLYNSETISAGGNEAMWALIALDSCDFEIPEDAEWTRAELKAEILKYKAKDGSFSWSTKDAATGGVDDTAMAIQALAPYYSESDIRVAVDGSLAYLKGKLDNDCKYDSSEATAQAIIALTELGKDPVAEDGFAKSVARTLITGLTMYEAENGGFKHLLADNRANNMATYQAMQAFEAYRRYVNEDNALFDLTDVNLRDTLEKRIAEAGKLKEADYEAALWAELVSAKSVAESVLANDQATDEQLKEAENNLAKAILALRESVKEPDGGDTPVIPPAGDEYVYLTVANPNGGYHIYNKQFALKSGATALSLLQETDLNVEVRYYAAYGSSYVVSINGVGEFDMGAQSGWMYKANGSAPEFGASSYVLKAGDKIEWLYTRNLGTDIGAGRIEKPEVSTGTAAGSVPGETITTTTTPTEVTVSGSTATATITKENVAETIKQASENKSAEIVVQVTEADTKGAETMKVQLDTTTVKDIVNKTEATLTVKAENTVVTLDRETLKTVAAEAAGSTVTLEIVEVKTPTAAQKAAAGENGHVIQLVIKSGNKVISLFNEGKATVTVAIPMKLDGKRVAAIHIGDDGKVEHLKGQEVTVGGKKHYRFDTPHFSTFALVDADEIGLEVEEETMSADEMKALLADLTPVARSVKTPNKNTKVTVKLDSADKAIIEELEAAGYTVKYNFYRSTKKSSKYESMLIKEGKTYTNTIGKKGTMYFYKVRVQVYDAEGKLIARTALKQCKYAKRVWTK